ncbi:helix-turn-helix domain-containing protein [Aggregatimonas sangjinii]|uniref:helix-turn-helix domain-containing protein n=1 Tax=Aggregatimonas sangjinii TaxID=2583587 RepID=UPI0015866266|nr:AraC family transcriptional regulator [Aggregatimonas sangjinii]
MGFQVTADLVPLFRGLVTGLQPFAAAQEVRLVFQTEVASLCASYNPEQVLSEITVLLSRVITFTPQSYAVFVSLGQCAEHPEHSLVAIENTGVDLSKMGEILSAVRHGLTVTRLEKGTRFTVMIPTKANSGTSKAVARNGTLLPKQYPMYHAVINKRLASYFSNTANFESAAEKKGASEGVFLKKVNAVIYSHMRDADFKVDSLASAMALSRTQLFRKIKALTQRSPQQYLRFVRLERAKKLLQSNEKDLNVSEVCYAVGFASKSHFTRSFQKEFGFKPSDYK